MELPEEFRKEWSALIAEYSEKDKAIVAQHSAVKPEWGGDTWTFKPQGFEHYQIYQEDTDEIVILEDGKTKYNTTWDWVTIESISNVGYLTMPLEDLVKFYDIVEKCQDFMRDFDKMWKELFEEKLPILCEAYGLDMEIDEYIITIDNKDFEPIATTWVWSDEFEEYKG